MTTTQEDDRRVLAVKWLRALRNHLRELGAEIPDIRQSHVKAMDQATLDHEIFFHKDLLARFKAEQDYVPVPAMQPAIPDYSAPLLTPTEPVYTEPELTQPPEESEPDYYRLAMAAVDKAREVGVPFAHAAALLLERNQPGDEILAELLVQFYVSMWSYMKATTGPVYEDYLIADPIKVPAA